MNAQELTSALGGRWHGSYGMCKCPSHEDRTPSLKVSDGDTATLLKCFAGCESRAVIDSLKGRGLWPDHGEQSNFKPAHRPPQRRRDDDSAKRSEMARALWNRAQPARGTPVDAYLGSRALTAEIPPTIRYLAGAKHSATGLILPAMLAAVTRWPGRGILAVHRTYLRADGKGKAPVSSPKMALGPISGAAVRLAAATDTLGLAEGIETGLSAMQMYGDPVWAACGSNMAGVVIPDTVKHLVVYADNGKAGERAAKKAAETFYRTDRKVTVVRPLDGHGDFNDYLQAQAEGRAA